VAAFFILFKYISPSWKNSLYVNASVTKNYDICITSIQNLLTKSGEDAMKIPILIISCLIFTCSIFAQTKFVSEEKYQKVEIGMRFEEVEKIFGVEGTLDTTVIYIWPENNLQVEWVQGKINSYSTTSAMLKEDQLNGYEKLKEACAGPEGALTYNKTYEEVVKLIGKEGQEPDWDRYIWWINEYKTIKIVFKAGKVKSKQMF
jgi:hypothetical protein